MKEFWKLKGDKVIWMIVVILAMVSVLAVFSSSSYLAASRDVSKTTIFFEQIKSVLIGFAALFICYLIPLKVYRFSSFIFFGISVAMLLLLFVPSLQDAKNGAVRGLKVAGHTIQVFEFAKVGVILYLAKALEIWEDSLYKFKDFALKIILPIGAVCLIVFVNSVSSALLIALVSFLVLFFLDVRGRNLAITLAIAVAAGLLMVGTYHAIFEGHPDLQKTAIGKVFNRVPTAEKRIFKFINGDEEEQVAANMSEMEKQRIEDEQRQSTNAKIAISEGGLIGKGPGKSTQRYSLSMAFSDFIYAFIIEEYGLILGGIGVIALYLVFLFRCIRLCGRCKKTYSSAMVIGLSFLIICQAFLHILVNVRLLPITGHTLPLISHGGTAYLVLCGVFGIILSINKQLDKQAREEAMQQQLIEQNQEMENETQSTDNY